MKYVIWFLWTILSVFFFLALSSTFGADVEYRGYDLVFTTDSDHALKIEDEDEVILEAASGDFFAFRKESGEVVAGQFGPVPLGWKYENYFFVEPTEIQPGLWLVEGDYTIYTHLSNNDAFTAKEVFVNRFAPDTLALMLTMFFWIVGIPLGSHFDH